MYCPFGKAIIAISLFLLSVGCSMAQTELKAEVLLARVDSAIGAGELNVAAELTLRALDEAKINNDIHLEAKLLINLISIKIEQENSINIDEWYDRALAILTQQKNDMELANLWNIKARHLMYNQKFDEARMFYNKVGEIYSPIQNDPVNAYYYNDLGYLEESLGNHQKAAGWYLKSIQIFEQTNDKSGLANSMGNLSNTYFNLNEPEKAIDYAQQSLKIRKQTGDKEGIAIVLGNITRMYFILEESDSARHYQKAYLYYARQSGKKKTLTDSYVNLAMLHHQGKRYEEAIANMKSAIGVGKEINHPNLANFYRMCALFYGKIKRVTEMNAYYDSAFVLIVANKNKTQYRDYYATRMNYFKSIGDYKSAFENYELYVAYKDSVLNESVKKQVAQLEIQYETQKKNVQIASERAERINQQLRYNIAISVLVLGLLCGLGIFYRYKYQKKLEQKNMLLAERNRISSELHDEIGSSLSAINLISHHAQNVKAKDEEKIREYFTIINTNSGKMMESISDIVWSMHPENDQMTRIIARMKSFMAEILEAVDTEYQFYVDDKVLPLTLTPEKRKDFYLVFKEAVNNSAKYANANKVTVTLRIQNQMLELSLADDGDGFNMDSETQGNGIRNMRERIQKHNGRFNISSHEGKGTQITIYMPYT